MLILNMEPTVVGSNEWPNHSVSISPSIIADWTRRGETGMALERAITLKCNFHYYLGSTDCGPHDDLVLIISVECPPNYVISVIIV